MSNIVGLRGEEIPSPGEVNPEAVDLAKELVGWAESGEINTILAIFVHSDGTVGSNQRGAKSYRLIGMLTKVLHDLCAEME